MTRHEKIKQLTLMGVLAACIIVLAFIPIRTVAFEITLTVIPIGVGAIIGGKKQGFLLGFVFGMVSFFQCFGYSPFGTLLFSMNPWMTFLVCVPTRVLAGGLPALFHDALSNKMNRHLCDAITCILVPLLNTVFFVAMFMIGFYHLAEVQSAVGLEGVGPIPFMSAMFLINGLVELGVCAVITFPIVKALHIALK